ncbi:MAG: signal peptidase II [Phycisphaeraceae bacterium]|nr:signal peptidase II [Phycisphaeraceae bacterium]
MSEADPSPTNPPDSVSATGRSLAHAGRHVPCLAVFLMIVLGVAAADLAIKSWSFNHVAFMPVLPDEQGHLDRDRVPDHQPMPLVPGLLSLRLTVNSGAVFGLGKGSQWLFILVSLIAVPVLGRIFWQSPRTAYALHAALALILAGALGNLYDRVVYHGVRDMFWLFPGWYLPFGWRWPNAGPDVYPWLFNLADASLVVGVVLMLLVLPRQSASPRKRG